MRVVIVGDVSRSLRRDCFYKTQQKAKEHALREKEISVPTVRGQKTAGTYYEVGRNAERIECSD